MVKRSQKAFSREIAELVRYAVGYRSRAFVTFGKPIALGDYDPEARRDLVALAHRIQDDVGRLYKVLPTALVAAAMRPQITRAGLTSRIDELLVSFRAEGANLAVHTGQEAVDEGVEQLTERGVLVQERQRVRVRDRFAERRTDVGCAAQGVLFPPCGQPDPQTRRLTLRHAPPGQLRAPVRGR